MAAQPRRIGGPNDFEYQRLYLFYQRLEQRERLRRLPRMTTIAVIISVPIMLTMCAWAYVHHDNVRQIAVTGQPD